MYRFKVVAGSLFLPDKNGKRKRRKAGSVVEYHKRLDLSFPNSIELLPGKSRKPVVEEEKPENKKTSKKAVKKSVRKKVVKKKTAK